MDLIGAGIEVDRIGGDLTHVDDVATGRPDPLTQSGREPGTRPAAIPADRHSGSTQPVDQGDAGEPIELGVELSGVGATADVICLEDGLGIQGAAV
jgi:hypothetical protein